MKKGQRVLNAISRNRATLVHGHMQPAPPHMECDFVYAVKLDNGQYRYWDILNVTQLINKKPLH